MRRIFFRSLMFCLAGVLAVGLWGAWRVWNVGRTAYGAYHHLRYLLESGETIEGAPANDVLSDSYLLGLFGNNAELADKLKAIIDLGMATDESLKTGEVTAMVVTYRQTKDGDITDPAIYAVGGFTNPKHTRFGFHSSGYFAQELDKNLWLSGNSVMNMLGRDIIVFCEQDKAEQHMSLLYDLLNGRIMPLAARIVESPLHYAIVFPAPRDIAPPNLRNYLSVVSVAGVMGPDDSSTEIRFVTGHPAKTARVQAILSDMVGLARMTFHDKFSGYVKEREWGGTQDDMWWATKYVALIDSMSLVSDPTLVAVRFSGDRVQNNAILKTIERAGCDLAAQKAFALTGDLPWEYVYNDRENPHGGYWSKEHQWGADWPLGDAGIPTPGSITAAAERERIRAEQEAAKAAEKAAKEAEKAAPAAQS